MPRNGSGVYTLPQAPFVAGTTISSAAVNSDFSDLAAAMTGSLPRDGQAGMSGQFKAADGSSIAPSITFASDTSTGFFKAAAGEIGVDISGTEIGFFDSTGWQGPSPLIPIIPVGSILDYGGASAPAKWVLAFGQALSRTTYALLFAVYSTTYGSGDGSTTFNIPDLRGSVTAGADNMGGSAASRLTTAFFGSDPTILGDRGGAQSKALTAGNVPAITSTGSNSITVNAGADLAATAGSVITSGGATGVANAAPASTNNSWFNISSLSGTNSISVTSTGTSGTAFGIIQPSLIVNKIIFAGV